VTAMLAWWGIVAAAVVCLAVALGLRINKRVMGILIDTRGRYSLTHFQVALWTITILSLIAGTCYHCRSDLAVKPTGPFSWLAAHLRQRHRERA
jgi:hypothetical protein